MHLIETNEGYLIFDEQQNCIAKIEISPIIDPQKRKETREALEKLFKENT